MMVIPKTSKKSKCGYFWIVVRFRVCNFKCFIDDGGTKSIKEKLCVVAMTFISKV
jgi:hypothetical protein